MWVMTSVETLGYYHMSLRDNDLARFFGSSLVANPSGIGLDGPAVQQPAEQLPEPGRGDGMTRQHLGQEDTKGPPAAPALAAIAAKDPLPP